MHTMVKLFCISPPHPHSPLRATLEVVVKPDRGQSGPRERLMEQFIASTCDSIILTKRHPHTAISIILQVEKDDGAVSLIFYRGGEWSWDIVNSLGCRCLLNLIKFKWDHIREKGPNVI